MISLFDNFVVVCSVLFKKYIIISYKKKMKLPLKSVTDANRVAKNKMNYKILF